MLQSTRLTLRNKIIIRKSLNMQNNIYSITIAQMHRLLIHRQTCDNRTNLIGWPQGWFLAETLSAPCIFQTSNGFERRSSSSKDKFVQELISNWSWIINELSLNHYQFLLESSFGKWSKINLKFKNFFTDIIY